MYPLTFSYNKCLGSRATSVSFANLRIVDLRNGQSQYLSTIKQLMDALPKTVDPSSRFALQGHIARPGQKRLRLSMRAAIWFLLPSDGTFRRSSTSLQYFLTRQGRRVVLRGGDVAYPPWNSHINWIPDPASPPSRDHGNLNFPSPSRHHGTQDTPPPFRDHGKENLPPQDAPRKLPRKLRPRRRKEKQSGPAANHNSPSRETGSRPGTGRSPRSAMRAPVKHPGLTANQNSGRQFDPDHPESGRLYKPARSGIPQDSTIRSCRDSFSGSGLSSPALQRSHRDSFSGSPAGLTRNAPLTGTPSGLTKKVSLTDPVRRGKIAGGLRPGPVQSHPRAACPDTRLEIDAALPEAAAVSRAERPPTVLDTPESGQLEPARRPESPHRRGSRSPRRHPRKRPRNHSSALYRPRKRPSHPGRWCE